MMRLAYAERDRHDWTSCRKLGCGLIAVEARVIVVHASARRERPAGDPQEVAAEAARELRTTLRLAEQVAGSPGGRRRGGEGNRGSRRGLRVDRRLLYRISTGLSPAAVAEISPRGDDHDDVTDNQDDGQHSGGGPA
jgi:hypothetical protein